MDSLTNPNSAEFSGLANNLTAAVSNNNKRIFLRINLIGMKIINAE